MHLIHTDWLHEHQNKAHIYAVYKKPTSDLKTYRPKARGWKNIIHANGKQKKAGVTIFILDKIYLKINKFAKIYGRTLHNDQGINPRGRHNNCKYLCTQHMSTSICKANTNRHKRRN